MSCTYIDRPDPLGPHRKIVEALRTESANCYLLDCGHTSEGVTHFHLDKVGMDRSCFTCGRIELALFNKDNPNA